MFKWKQFEIFDTDLYVQRNASVSSSGGKFLFLFLRTQLLVTYFSRSLELLRLEGMFFINLSFR